VSLDQSFRRQVAARDVGGSLRRCLALVVVAGSWCLSGAACADTFRLPPAGTDIVGEIRMVDARYEDTLLDIARRYDLGHNEITEANPGVDPWLPGEGMPVLLPTQFVLPDAPREGIVLNVAAMRLFYFPKPKKGQFPVVITHPVGVGRQNWETPLGVTRISAKVPNPTWHVPTSVQAEHEARGDPLPDVVPPGPDNPLGQYAMPLALQGYVIHGTNRPWGVGMRVSHGCVRLYPEDIERLFAEVPVGTPVRIVNQPYVAGWFNGMLYLQAHRPLEEDRARWAGSLTPLMEVILGKVKDFRMVDWDKALAAVREHRGLPVPILSAEGAGRSLPQQ
jgi:L,D-transpeptidase ErfK/SrfK